MHNCLNNTAPAEIISLLHYGESNRTLKLQETRYNNKYGVRAFSHFAPKLWNLLPKKIRDSTETEEFKKLLKTFLMVRGDEFLNWIEMRWIKNNLTLLRMPPSSVPLPLLGVTNGSTDQHLPWNLPTNNPISNLTPPTFPPIIYRHGKCGERRVVVDGRKIGIGKQWMKCWYFK